MITFVHVKWYVVHFSCRAAMNQPDNNWFIVKQGLSAYDPQTLHIPSHFFLLLFRYYTADQTTHNSITLLFCESYANQLPLISLVLLLLLLCSRRREKWRLCIPILGPFVFHIFQQDTGLLLNYTKKISCFVPFFLGEGHSHKRAEQSSSLTEPISIKQSMIKMVIHA